MFVACGGIEYSHDRLISDRSIPKTKWDSVSMGKLLDFYQATQAKRNADVDRAEIDKEKAVEEAASLERDIATLANNLDKAFTVNLLGPIVHVTNVADGAQQEMKVEVTHSEDGFSFDVEEADKKSSHSEKTFYPFIVGWLKHAQRPS